MHINCHVVTVTIKDGGEEASKQSKNHNNFQKSYPFRN